MTFEARLKIEGLDSSVQALDGEYLVHKFHYELHQETDVTGQPSSVVRGGLLYITIESTHETTLFEWMCENFDRKSGYIRFLKPDTNATLKQLEFSAAYLISYSEDFDHADKKTTVQNLVISAKEINMGNGTHSNVWPE